jgi:prevent-host-death family protein
MVIKSKTAEKRRYPQGSSNVSFSAAEHIAAGEFKARCLKILDDVQSSRRGVVVTKHGKPVARVVPIEDLESAATLKSSVEYEGDLISPIDATWTVSS